MEATDDDSGDNGDVSYSILSVSDDAADKFRIHSDSGQIAVTDEVSRGDMYLITVEAQDRSETDPRWVYNLHLGK